MDAIDLGLKVRGHPTLGLLHLRRDRRHDGGLGFQSPSVRACTCTVRTKELEGVPCWQRGIATEARVLPEQFFLGVLCEEGGYAAGYIRVSSANQDVQRSVAAQKELIQEFVQEHGSGNIVWYVDIGNGIALPALKRFMTDARSPDRCFDQVLVYKMSRLSRNLADYQGIMSEL